MRPDSGKAGGAGGTATGGFTLIEVLTVIAIIGILVIAMGFSFVGWRAKYDVEGEVKKLYVDLSNARVSAMQSKMTFFLNMPAAESRKYYIYEDNYPAPDGNGALETANDAKTIEKELNYNIVTDIRHMGFNRSGLAFNSSGTIMTQRSIHLEDIEGEDLNADLDCLAIVSTRINLGLWNGTTGECEAQ